MRRTNGSAPSSRTAPLPLTERMPSTKAGIWREDRFFGGIYSQFIGKLQVYAKVNRREKHGGQAEDVAARFGAKTKSVEPAMNTTPESTDALVERLKKKQKRRQKD